MPPTTATCTNPDCEALVTLRDDVKWCNACGSDLEGQPPRAAYKRERAPINPNDPESETYLTGRFVLDPTYKPAKGTKSQPKET